MATFGELNATILDELERTGDLTSQANTAIKDAIAYYDKDRFFFNEVRGWQVTVPDQEFYALPADLIEIDSLTINVNTGTYELDEVPYDLIEAIYTNATFTGNPVQYAVYDEQLRLYPIPDETHTLVMSYTFKLPELSATSDTSAWLTDGKELIKYRAKWALYMNYVRDKEMAMMMKMAEQDELNALQERTLRRTTGGGIIPRL